MELFRDIIWKRLNFIFIFIKSTFIERKFLKAFSHVRKIYMARDGKYSHCAGKFTDTIRVKD
jgi:hypothetical protein